MTNSVNKYILKPGSSRNILSINNFTGQVPSKQNNWEIY